MGVARSKLCWGRVLLGVATGGSGWGTDEVWVWPEVRVWVESGVGVAQGGSLAQGPVVCLGSLRPRLKWALVWGGVNVGGRAKLGRSLPGNS